MSRNPERRHSARLTIPPQFRDHGAESQSVRLVDLSAGGARVEHTDPLHAGLPCVVELPPALGGGRLRGRVVWTRLHHVENSVEGGQRRYSQSGLVWVGFTPEQLGALAAALEVLQTAQEG
jgi:hypothetical protein